MRDAFSVPFILSWFSVNSVLKSLLSALTLKKCYRRVMKNILNKFHQGARTIIILMIYAGIALRCFDIVFPRPYRHLLIALKVILSLPDRYKIFTSD